MSFYIDNFKTIFGNKNNIQVLRNKVLELAVRGKLVEQNPNDEPASELIKKIKIESHDLIKKGKVKKQKLAYGNETSKVPFDIPNGWEWVKLGIIAQNIKGVTFSKDVAKKESTLNSVLILRGGNIHPQTEKLLFNDNLYIPKDIVKVEQYLQKGDTILVASSGTKSSIAKSAFIEETHKNTSVGAFLFIIRPLEVEPLYIRCLIRYFRQSIIDDTSGTNISNVGKEQLDNMPIPLPPLIEQKRIVAKVESIMSDIDNLEKSIQKKGHLLGMLPKSVVDAIGKCKNGVELKEQLQFVIDNFDALFHTTESLQELRNVVLQLAIEGKLVPQDPSDEPASKLIKKIEAEKDKLVKEGKIKKEKPLPRIEEDEIPFEIPESWRWVRLSDVSLIKMGQSPNGSSYNAKGLGVPLINGPVEFNKGNYSKTKLEKYTTEPTQMCDKGDILICVRGATTGRTNIADFDACIGRGVASIKPLINTRYLHHYIVKMQYDILSKGKGSTFPNLSKDQIENYVFALPPLAEQNRIVQKIESMMGLIGQLENKLKRKVDLTGKMASM